MSAFDMLPINDLAMKATDGAHLVVTALGAYGASDHVSE